MSSTLRSPNGLGNRTATAGTVIRVACGGEGPLYQTFLCGVVYTPGATAHVLTAMRAASGSTVLSDVAATGTVVNSVAQLTDGGGNILAANDVIGVLLDNNVWHITTVSSVSNLAITMADAVPSGRTIPAKALIFCYGVPGDSYHSDYQRTASASTKLTWPECGIGIVKSVIQGAPIVVSSANGTNAGTFDSISWAYVAV